MTKRRTVYPDLIRVIALVFVMGLMVSMDIVGFSTSRYVGKIYEIGKVGIVLFIMLSGMFLLDPNKYVDEKGVFKKYLLRVVIATVLWGYIYALVKAFFSGQGANSFLDALVYVLSGKILMSYLGMLTPAFALYILVPFLRVFIRNATTKDIEYIMLVTFITGSLLPMIASMFGMTSNWFEVFSGVSIYIGVFVSGYYFRIMTLPKKQLSYLVFLGVLSLIIMASMAQISNSFLNLYPDTLFLAITIFVLIKSVLNNRWLKPRIVKNIGLVSRYSFGIFLIQGIIYEAVKAIGFTATVLPFVFSIPLIVIINFMLSFVVCHFIYKIPFVRQYLI